jgi:hypothetical protein
MNTFASADIFVFKMISHERFHVYLLLSLFSVYNLTNMDVNLIADSRLRSLVIIELSREIPKWSIHCIDNDLGKVTLSSPKKSRPVLNFYIKLLSLGIVPLFFLARKRSNLIKRVIEKNDLPFLDNYLNAPFTRFMKNTYSQSGEDGVILEIARRLNILDSGRGDFTVIEFGAWDGKHLSNTFSLVESYACRALYIEADIKRFQDLITTAEHFPSITPLNARVEADPNASNSLDNILDRLGYSNDPAILSIDIDSSDLDIWESLKRHKPKIIVIEINSSIPPGIYLRQGHHVNGNSFSATLAVGKAKGYSLVAHTGNMIFVRDDLVPDLEIDKRYLNFPELLFRSEEVFFHSDIRFFTALFRPFQKTFLRVSYKLMKITRL